MGPQSFDCGKPVPGATARFLGSASMGPQSFDCGKATHHATTSAMSLLQWGRSLSTAESGVGSRRDFPRRGSFNGAAVFRLRKGRGLHRLSLHVPASMGPQSFDCGKTLACRFNRLSDHGFNGAAVFRLRKVTPPPLPPDEPPGFNGAAVFRLRKDSRRSAFVCRSLCFNGAAVFRLRKARCQRPASRRPSSFNGAAVFRLRKAQPSLDSKEHVMVASMGPQSFDCGKKPLRGLRSLNEESFNGAAVFRLRKDVASEEEVGAKQASMGPQSFDCGKPLVNGISSRADGASMGPQSFDCGKGWS